MKRQRTICSILLLGFLLGIYEGKVALWKDNQKQPLRVFPYKASMLPKQDQQALKKGIHIENIQQLQQLIEDYLS